MPKRGWGRKEKKKEKNICVNGQRVKRSKIRNRKQNKQTKKESSLSGSRGRGIAEDFQPVTNPGSQRSLHAFGLVWFSIIHRDHHSSASKINCKEKRIVSSAKPSPAHGPPSSPQSTYSALSPHHGSSIMWRLTGASFAWPL